jgi:hypothetical protein
MLPLTSRRRARRRTFNRRLVVFGGAILVTVLVIGGLTQVSRNSGPYTAQMNRSFGSQVTAVADASNVTAASVRQLMKTLPTQDRQGLQVELDSAVAQTAQQATQADSFATPPPPGQVAQHFSTIFSDRAEATSQLRSAIDGLLGMHPLPVAGAATGGTAVVSTPTLLSSTQATNRIAAAGSLLAQSDRNYAAVRRALRGSAGRARLPASAWITDRQVWQVGAVATQVDQVSASTTLAASNQLALTSVRLTPPALPSPTGVVTPGVSTLSPTTGVSVSVVLSNLGTVDDPRATVHITLADQTGGGTVAQSRTTAIAASRSVTLAPAAFRIKPGRSYQLTVAIVLPAAQTVTANTSVSQVLQVAPTSPTTTVAK